MVQEENKEARSKGAKPFDLVFFTARGPGSYTTGGFNVDLGFMRAVTDAGVVQTTGTYSSACPENAISGQATKVLVRNLASSGAEVASATNLSAVLVKLLVKGSA